MHSVLYKKQNLTGYIQYYKQNGGTDTKAMGQTEPHFLSDPMSDRKKELSPTLRNIYKKQHGTRPCVEKMQLIFFVPPNKELDYTPKNLDVPPKMKVKGYMYPQMKKPVGMLHVNTTDYFFNRPQVRCLFLARKLFLIPYFIRWISIKLGEYINN